MRVARAIADELRRPLAIVPFESKYERESTLAQEVNALLSSGVCDMASGFALLASDLGAPGRPTARVPDYPGAKRAAAAAVGARSARSSPTPRLSRDGDGRWWCATRRAPRQHWPTSAMPGSAWSAARSPAPSSRLYRNGKLRPQIVSLSQNQNVARGARGRPLGRDAGRLRPARRLAPGASGETTLRRAAYTHPLRINIGFVALSEAQASWSTRPIA